MVAMARHFMAGRDNRRHGVGVALRDAAAGEKSRLHFVCGKDAENAPDAGVRTVFGLSIFFVIHFAVLIRPNVFTALEIEAKKHRDSSVARPGYFAAAM